MEYGGLTAAAEIATLGVVRSTAYRPGGHSRD
jgi:hypothetical protein